jgi:transglutaminase-like putative cysteine protease
MIPKLDNFEAFFRTISYGVVFCGFLSLYSTGDMGIAISALFFLALIIAWFFEDSRWQISERVGTVSLFIVVPFFYIAWKYRLVGVGANESQIAGMLARMILILASIKIFQKKSDRDWLFLYLMAFFEVLLAAGMSISPLYLASLILYLLVNICAIITFEIRKTSYSIGTKITAKKKEFNDSKLRKTPFKRLPLTAVALLILIITIATPLFFALPRTGGAGFGNNSKGLSGFTGFSDSVELGSIGQLKQNDEVVMRVVLDRSDNGNNQSLRWRGVALDKFDNKRWSKSDANLEPYVKLGSDFFQFDKRATSVEDIAIQTIYLEPIDSNVLFTLSRPFAAEQTTFGEIFKDSNGGIAFSRKEEFERVTYTIYSDRKIPSEDELRKDNSLYSAEIKDKYLQLPEKYNARINQLAAQVTENVANRYDKAKAIENYLQTQFGYTLQMKASGDEPLADFLFNVREGHCEYFATAMTIMLRTQGIAARVVNGFQQGEYNETAGAFIVKQKDAHSWVEVYFPENDAWITFDPTPFAGQSNESQNVGILGSFNKYIEAFETLWVKYFVAYDNQDQRSLFRSVKNGFVDFQAETSSWIKVAEKQITDWWKEVRGDKGLQASAIAVAYGIGYILAAVLGIFLIIWLYRKLRKLEFWKNWREWLKQKNDATIIEFYERMQKVLASKGFTREPHQTPLEFAFALKMPEAVKITEKYNRVRFGEKDLSNDEAKEIENWLEKLENKES